jgi:hypothetical protein
MVHYITTARADRGVEYNSMRTAACMRFSREPRRRRRCADAVAWRPQAETLDTYVDWKRRHPTGVVEAIPA